MSNTAKAVAIVVVVLLALGGVYYLYTSSHAGMPTNQEAATNAESSSLPSGNASSDQALTQDMTAIDTQIQAVGTDNANASQSIDAAAQ